MSLRASFLFALLQVVACVSGPTPDSDPPAAARDRNDFGASRGGALPGAADAGQDAQDDGRDTLERDAAAVITSPCADGPITIDDASAPRTIVIEDGGCVLTLELLEPRVLAFRADGAALSFAGQVEDEPGWLAPRKLEAGAYAIVLMGQGPTTFAIQDLGAPAGAIDRDRSVTWRDPTLLDDRALVGLGRLMAAIADDDHGGVLLDDWFRRFGTTAHSERLGPGFLLADFAESAGSNPRNWNLSELPFVVTGVHNRIDLRNQTHCGELRVSLASEHPLYKPFHLIFLFAQAPLTGDRSPSGSLHCTETALRWARLSELSDQDFRAAARRWLDEGLSGTAFIAAESLEFIISPWEWRQWFPVAGTDAALPRVLENRPLFQTLDVPRLNREGPDREAFLQFVADNAEALAARTLAIPDRFRSPSARLNQGVPWVPLDLSGLAPEVLARAPDLRQNLELVGCPACHAADAEFVQTLPDRSVSPFYDKELDARAAHLAALTAGRPAQAPFGPLQPAPVLPP